MSSNIGNIYSPVITVAPITSEPKKELPTHVKIYAQSCGLPEDSIVLLEQIKTINKRDLKNKVGRTSIEVLSEIEEGLAISLGLPNSNYSISN